MVGENMATIIIDSGGKKFFIDEKKCVVKQFNNKKKSLIKKIKFKLPLQSNLTHKCVAKIFKYGKSELPSLSESYLIHLPLIRLFNKHLFKLKGKVFLKCPIT